MNSSLILLPSVAMFALTMGCIFAMGRARFRAIRAGEVSIRYFRTYNEGEQTAQLHLLQRHVQNHFEVPPLFHVAVVASYAVGAVTPISLGLAWLYVIGRVAHTAIHLGGNNVTWRFYTFGATLLVLSGLWLHLAIHLARS